MQAVRFVVGRWSWRRRVGLLALLALAAGSLSFVMLAALGAHRAGGAWERLQTRSRADDLLLDVTSIDAARAVSRQVTAIPGVARAVPLAYAYIIPEGRQADFFGGVLLPLERGLLETVWRPVLTDGRLPDPVRADEVVVNAKFVRETGAAVGDRVSLTDPAGLVHQGVTVVGVGVLPIDFTFAASSPIALPTPAFASRWATQIEQLLDRFGTENVGPAVAIVAEPGVGGEELERRVTAAVPREEILAVDTPSSTAETVTDTLELQRNAFAVVALASGIAVVAVLALALAQVTFLRPEETTALRAIGFDRRQRRLTVLLPGAVVAFGGVAGALALTVALQWLVPTGLAAHVDVGRSIEHDAEFLVLSAIIALAVLGGVVGTVAWRSTAVASGAPVRRNLGARLVAYPSLAVGVRAAGGGLTRRGRRQAIAAIAMVAVAVVGAGVTGVVVKSRDLLSREPKLSGVFYDAFVGTYTDASQVDEDRAELLSAAPISGIVTVDIVVVTVDRLAAEGIVVTVDKGHLRPPVLSGRTAVGANEMLVTPSYLRRLSKAVGDRVTVEGPAGPRVFRVVGTAAFPFAGSSANGEQIALTPEGRDALALEPAGYVLGVTLRQPESARAIAAHSDVPAACPTKPVLALLGVRRLPGAAAGDLTPCVAVVSQRVVNLRELGAAPVLLVALLAALGLAGVAYFLGATFGQVARELGVLRALGFTRRQVTTVPLVEAGTIGLVGSVVAVPLGIILGRGVWQAVTDNLGVVEHARLSTLGALGAPAAAVLAAMLCAVVPIVLVIRQRAASQLRAE